MNANAYRIERNGLKGIFVKTCQDHPWLTLGAAFATGIALSSASGRTVLRVGSKTVGLAAVPSLVSLESILSATFLSALGAAFSSRTKY